MSPRGIDGGVDIDARRDGQRLIVQAKMYAGTPRNVTVRQVKDLHGTAVLHDAAALLVCDKSLPATVDEACGKLGVATRLISSDALPDDTPTPDDLFERIWVDQVQPLDGQTVPRRHGEPTTILQVDDRGLRRRGRGSGKAQPVPIEAFAVVVRELHEHGSYTLAEFRQSEWYGTYSALVFDLLASLPQFERDPDSPTLRLRLGNTGAVV